MPTAINSRMLSGVNMHPSTCYIHQVPRVLGVLGVKLLHLGDMELKGPSDTYQDEGWRGRGGRDLPLRCCRLGRPDDSCQLCKARMYRGANPGEHTAQQPQKQSRYLRVCVPATPSQGEATGGRGAVTRSRGSQRPSHCIGLLCVPKDTCV